MKASIQTRGESSRETNHERLKRNDSTLTLAEVSELVVIGKAVKTVEDQIYYIAKD